MFRRSTIAAIVLVAAFCLQAVLAISKLSATSDEPVHIAAGYSYWRTRDFRMNPEHPPLAKLLATMPLLAIPVRFDTSIDNWNIGAQDAFGHRFLYENHADRLLFWARIPMVVLAAIGAIATFLWARDLFGVEAGLFALGLYAFSPNLLGHAMLVTTDVPLAAFTILTLYLFWKRGEQPSWYADAITGLALGAAMASKFSGALLPFILIGFCVARKQVRSLLIMAAASLLVIEISYLFSASPLLYFRNAMLVNANHIKDYPVYMLGELKPGGWWYYFLVAFVFKATLPTLASIVLAAVSVKAGLMNRCGESILLLSMGVILMMTSMGADQIGVRYLLPVFPLLFVWVSRIVPVLVKAHSGTVAVGLLLAWHAWSAFSAFPNYIPYFNEMAGGAGADILDDSNIDWGQGMKQAAEYVRARQLHPTAMYSFSPGDNPEYYGLPRNLRQSEIPGLLFTKPPFPGLYIISAHRVNRMRQADPAWKTYKPVDQIGRSLWVYSF